MGRDALPERKGRTLTVTACVLRFLNNCLARVTHEQEEYFEILTTISTSTGWRVVEDEARKVLISVGEGKLTGYEPIH